MSFTVRFEQAVYGSFPFRDGGYAPLASSPGCRSEWLDPFHAACRSIGEKPRTAVDLAGMMFSLRIGRRGPWMIVGVSSPGSDDRGRPDALAFHGLFVSRKKFRKVGSSPFALSGALRDDWGPGTTLSAGSVAAISPPTQVAGEKARSVATTLRLGRKVAIASDAPIADLAREVWSILPLRDRERCSVATWAFANGPVFRLVAAPSLAGWELDDSYVDPSAGPQTPARRRPVRSWIIAAGIVAVAVAVAALGASKWWAAGRAARPFAPQSPKGKLSGTLARHPWMSSPILRPTDRSPGPDRATYADRDSGPRDAPEVLASLEAFHAVFRGIVTSDHDPFTGDEVDIFSPPNDRDLKTVLMRRVHAWRYTGPLLTDSELAEIAKSSAEGRSRALAWDRLIRHFVADRPLPANLATGPLRWRIDTLAWSFHLEPDPRLTPVEAVDAIADALKLDEPLAVNPLETKYPALAEYAWFLMRVPVR